MNFKIVFVGFTAVTFLIVVSYITSVSASNKELESKVIQYLVEDKEIEEDHILATKVFGSKGANIVGVYYSFDRDYVYRYYKSQIDGEIVEDGKREIQATDSWLSPYLE